MQNNPNNNFGSMHWFIGVVEDRINDPIKLGRVKVRCFGYHTEDKTQISTEDLPWAQVAMSTSNPGTSGLGTSPSFLVEGSWVIGFFLDGSRAQEPCVIGSLPGIPAQQKNNTDGFTDPNGKFPKPEYIDKPDINKRALANYPFNKVFESESGHVIEIDDTPGLERISETHKSGTGYEVDENGNKVTRIKNDNYTIIAGDDTVDISGNAHLTISGNLRLSVSGGCSITSGGDMSLTAPRIDLNGQRAV